MQAHLRALLRRLAKGEREFPHPTDDLVEALHILESYGWVENVVTTRSPRAAGHPWYLASAVITDEGPNVITEED